MKSLITYYDTFLAIDYIYLHKQNIAQDAELTLAKFYKK